MNTDIKTLAALVATQVWCNGEFSEVEKETAGEIAEAFELPIDEFNGLVEDCISKVDKLDEDAITEFLAETAKKVAEEDVEPIYEALMEMALCDGELTIDEVNNLLATADAFGMGNEKAVLLLCDMVKNEPELEISFE